MSILASTYLSLGSILVQLKNYTQETTICENALYKIQNEFSKEMNQLFALNPKALRYRVQLKLAQLELAAASASLNAPAAARAEAKIVRIQTLQTQLSLMQQDHLNRTRIMSQEKIILLRRDLRKIIQLSMPIGLAVEADIAGEIAPLYVPKANFKIQQSAQVQFIRTARPSSCAATIENRGTTFRPVLLKTNT
jgi:hypothetical protein